MKDLIKAVVILLLYAGAAPALGSFLARNRIWERWVLALMMFMPGWHPGKLTLMVVSVETYRGHTKGFEYCHLDVLGLAMIIAAAIRDGPRFKWASPGAYLYLAYCIGSCLCVFSAYDHLYLAMAAWKFTKVLVVMVGFYHGFRDAEDLRWVMRSMAAALVLQGLVGLKMRFLDGVWQVKGWFEHQNPMAMWCYLLAGPVLGWAFLPQVKGRDVWLCLAAGAFAAFLAGLLALDSLMARMQEVDSRDESEDLRDILNKQSRAMLHDHPLGIGWNNFGVANSLPVPRVYNHFTWDAKARQIREVYDWVLKRRPTKPDWGIPIRP